MRRREFIAAIGGVAAMPFVATAQQIARIPRLVFLHGRAEDDLEEQARIVAFRQGLEALGWTANRTYGLSINFPQAILPEFRLLPQGRWVRHRTSLSPVAPLSWRR